LILILGPFSAFFPFTVSWLRGACSFGTVAPPRWDPGSECSALRPSCEMPRPYERVSTVSFFQTDLLSRLSPLTVPRKSIFFPRLPCSDTTHSLVLPPTTTFDSIHSISLTSSQIASLCGPPPLIPCASLERSSPLRLRICQPHAPSSQLRGSLVPFCTVPSISGLFLGPHAPP